MMIEYNCVLCDDIVKVDEKYTVSFQVKCRTCEKALEVKRQKEIKEWIKERNKLLKEVE